MIKDCLVIVTDAVFLDDDDDDVGGGRLYRTNNDISSRLHTLGLCSFQRQEEPFPGPHSDPLWLYPSMVQSPYGQRFAHPLCVPGLHIQGRDECLR